MTPRPAGEARALAAGLVAELAAREPRLVSVAGIALGPALEQRLFFAARDGVASVGARGRSQARVADMARLVAATAAAAIGVLARRAHQPRVMVLIREPTHIEVVARLRDALGTRGVPLGVIRAGRAASIGAATVPGAASPRLATQLTPRAVRELAGLQALVAGRLATATPGWPDALRDLAAGELPRIALGALALRDAARRSHAPVLVAFDEVGTWARILPAVAASLNVPSLDLPHAEAADPIAIRGAGYDRLAVYGPRAASVLEAAGISPERIVEIGAPRFDPLVTATAQAAPPGDERPRRIVYARQYVTGAMTAALLAACDRAAVAVAAAIPDAELVTVRHPADPVRGHGGPSLHEALPGAWALVTGWSNSVLEAAIAGVPAITIAPGDVAPIDYAADGLALPAGDAAAAVAAARRLLEPSTRASMLAGARDAVTRRIGPLDGQATERAAALIAEMAEAARAA